MLKAIQLPHLFRKTCVFFSLSLIPDTKLFIIRYLEFVKLAWDYKGNQGTVADLMLLQDLRWSSLRQQLLTADSHELFCHKELFCHQRCCSSPRSLSTSTEGNSLKLQRATSVYSFLWMNVFSGIPQELKKDFFYGKIISECFRNSFIFLLLKML